MKTTQSPIGGYPWLLCSQTFIVISEGYKYEMFTCTSFPFFLWILIVRYFGIVHEIIKSDIGSCSATEHHTTQFVNPTDTEAIAVARVHTSAMIVYMTVVGVKMSALWDAQ